MKYFVYTRKSTEDEEKQVLSLASQLDKAHEMFPDLDLIELSPESASAFKPDNRPVFTDMLRRIDAGEAHGIVAWHPDRLSRNALDSANITYRVGTGAILDLKFGSYTFDNSPEGMMMLQMTMSQSQYTSAKLSKDVKRGNEKKLKLGWKTGWAPTGYLNTPDLNKGEKIIINDPDRFGLVRQMWDLMLTGNYSVPDVLAIASDDWGYRTRQTKHQGGTPLSRSALYGIFINPFYAGLIRHNGELYQGSHAPMITLAEFDRVQTLLGRKGRPRPKTHSFAFRGAITCGECGCAVTAETKQKYIKSTSETRKYTYYHCTHKRQCSQRSSISEEQIIEQVDERLSDITIIPEFRDWALDALRNSHGNEVAERGEIQRSQATSVLKCQRQLDNLTSMRLNDLLSDAEYVEQRERLSGELRHLKELLHDTEARGERWLELTEKVFDFSTNARRVFRDGTDDERRTIFGQLGGNITLLDKRLNIEYHPWFTPIAEKYPEIARAFEEVRTKEFDSPKEKKAAIAAIHSNWLRGLDSNQRPRR